MLRQSTARDGSLRLERARNRPARYAALVIAALAGSARLWLSSSDVFHIAAAVLAASAVVTLLIPSLELRVAPQTLRKCYVWWLPLLGNVGFGPTLERQQVTSIFLEAEKTGTNSSGSDTIKWVVCLSGARQTPLWRYGSKERARVASERIAGVLGVPARARWD